MGNCPTDLRQAIRLDRLDMVTEVLNKAGDNAANVINEDHSQDCLMRSCTPAHGNAFYYAVTRNKLRIAELMLERGADMYSPGIIGETCLHAASRNNNLPMVQLLLKNGMDVDATDDLGRYATHAAAASIYNTSEVLRFLLLGQTQSSAGEWQEGQTSDKVDQTDYQENTPLHDACLRGNSEVAKTLVFLGADVNRKNKYNKTPWECLPDKNFQLDGLLNFFREKGANMSEGYQTAG